MSIEFKTPKCYMFAGMPGKGKSHILGYLIHYFTYLNKAIAKKDRFKFGAVFGDPASIGEYNFLPKKHLFACSDSKEIDGVFGGYIDRLQEMNRQLNIQKNGPAKEDSEFNEEFEVLLPPNFVVLDDIVGVLNSQSKTFNKFITTFRKTNTTVFIAVQYINTNISTTTRQCIEYAFMFDFDNEKTQKALYNAFGIGFDSFIKYKNHIQPMLQNEYSGVDGSAQPVTMSHPCVLYIRSAQNINDRYLRIQAPQYKKIRISFKNAKQESEKRHGTIPE